MDDAPTSPARPVRAGAPTLSRLTALDPAAFAREHWDQRALLTRAADLPAGFADLLGAEVVDTLVAERGLRAPFFRVVEQAATVPGMTRSAVAGSRTVPDLADPDAIARAHAGGATLVLQSLHRLWPPVGRFCRELAAELGHETQCNAYVTPAGNARGFAFHHDTHDVFVLQVEGSKRWQVHRPVLELPTRSQPRSGADLVPAEQEPLLDVTLHPGDVLYLPRGHVHAAETTDEPSVHLTVGVVAVTWCDVLRDAMTTLAPQELTLRQALPIAAAGPVDADAAAADLLKRTGDWLATLRPEQVADLVRGRLRRAQAAEPVGVLAQAAAARDLRPDSPLRPRRGTHAEVTVGGGRVAVTARGRRTSLPGIAEPMLRAVLAAPTTPAELVAGDPHCDVDDALVVVRRLLREGLLVAGG